MPLFPCEKITTLIASSDLFGPQMGYANSALCSTTSTSWGKILVTIALSTVSSLKLLTRDKTWDISHIGYFSILHSVYNWNVTESITPYVKITSFINTLSKFIHMALRTAHQTPQESQEDLESLCLLTCRSIPGNINHLKALGSIY